MSLTTSQNTADSQGQGQDIEMDVTDTELVEVPDEDKDVNNIPDTGTGETDKEEPKSEGPHLTDTAGFALSDTLSQLEGYIPTLPDAIASHYLQQAGFSDSDPRMTRLISIAAQKHICDIVNEAYTHCKLRASAPQGKGPKAKADKKLTLTGEDLTPVLAEYGVTVKKPPYYM